jgi:hypothetical protein
LTLCGRLSLFVALWLCFSCFTFTNCLGFSQSGLTFGLLVFGLLFGFTL